MEQWSIVRWWSHFVTICAFIPTAMQFYPTLTCLNLTPTHLEENMSPGQVRGVAGSVGEFTDLGYKLSTWHLYADVQEKERDEVHKCYIGEVGFEDSLVHKVCQVH